GEISQRRRAAPGAIVDADHALRAGLRFAFANECFQRRPGEQQDDTVDSDQEHNGRGGMQERSDEHQERESGVSEFQAKDVTAAVTELAALPGSENIDESVKR